MCVCVCVCVCVHAYVYVPYITAFCIIKAIKSHTKL